MKKTLLLISTLFVFLAVSAPARSAAAEHTSAGAQGGGADLAQELTNPLADLMTIPIQMNYDQDLGHADDGWKLQTNVQPVIPFHLSEDWNLISRRVSFSSAGQFRAAQASLAPSVPKECFEL